MTSSDRIRRRAVRGLHSDLHSVGEREGDGRINQGGIGIVRYTNSSLRLARIAALGVAFMGWTAVAPERAQAQMGDWGSTLVGVAETSGDEVTLLLGQVSLHPGGLGVMPVVSLQSYWVDHPGGSTWAVEPAVGLRYRAQTGALQGKVGYAWKNDDDDGTAFPFFGGGESGVTTSAQADYWDAGAFGLQGIGSYNWGSEYLWSRARGTVRAMQGDWGNLHVGGEVGWQGNMAEETTEYQALQYGPVLQWNSGNMLTMVFGAGWKDWESTTRPTPLTEVVSEDNDWYVKVEFVVSP